MPHISGIITKNNRSLLYKDLQEITTFQKLRNKRKLHYANNLCAIDILTGFYDIESSRELISVASNSRALLCGRLFRKSNGTAVTIDDINIDAIQKSSGKELADNYWGRYICIILSEETISFYRDPQGLASLYYKELEDGYIFATDIATIFDCAEEKPQLNWAYLLSFITSNYSVSSITPFHDVYEILAGCETILRVDKKPVIQQFWNPTTIKSTFISDEKHLQENIYETSRMVLNSWVQGGNVLTVEISGGLDSSSLLALLGNTKHENKVQGVNYFNSSVSASDERAYAQDVCNLYNVPLTYIDSREELPFSQTELYVRHDRPSSMLLYPISSLSIGGSMDISKEDEVISGQGGDHLFFAAPPYEAYVDSILERGFFRSNSVLKDLCAYYRMPYTKLFRYALKNYADYKMGTFNPSYFVGNYETWMNEEFKRNINPSLFKPFFWDDLTNVLPGKAQQILAIVSATAYIDKGHNIQGKPVINPLLSQPLVELALTIPSYQTFQEGYDRFHFRKAMSRHLKGKFMWRKSKGETSGSLVQGVRKNFNELQAFLLEGIVAKKGYLDKEALNRSLNSFRTGKTNNPWPIINLFVVEKWLRSWQK